MIITSCRSLRFTTLLPRVQSRHDLSGTMEPLMMLAARIHQGTLPSSRDLASAEHAQRGQLREDAMSPPETKAKSGRFTCTCVRATCHTDGYSLSVIAQIYVLLLFSLGI